jgi:hypothetical protein
MTSDSSATSEEIVSVFVDVSAESSRPFKSTVTWMDSLLI